MNTRAISLTSIRRSAQTHGARRLLTLALLIFGLQALTPVGYMPAALESGWYMRLCPSSLPSNVPSNAMTLPNGDHHAGHERDASDQHEGRVTDCPFSALANAQFTDAGAAALIVAATGAVARPRSSSASFHPSFFSGPYYSRAPPSV